MRLREPYNETVRRHFAHPLHAGDPQAGYPRTQVAEASGGGAGFRVVLWAALAGDVLEQLRFRVFGCPHLVAAAEATCSRFQGRNAAALDEFSVAELMSLLDVPVEKTGRILLLEDAVRDLANAIHREQMGARDNRRN